MIGAVSAATALLMAIAVLFGGIVSRLVPHFALQFFAGILFIFFGLWTLFGGDDEDEGTVRTASRGRHPFYIIFSSFFLAELGDKTQLAAFGLSARYGDPLNVWLAATAGMVAVNVVAALTGAWISRRIPGNLIKLVSAGIFIVFGLITLIGLGG